MRLEMRLKKTFTVSCCDFTYTDEYREVAELALLDHISLKHPVLYTKIMVKVNNHRILNDVQYSEQQIRVIARIILSGMIDF